MGFMTGLLGFAKGAADDVNTAFDNTQKMQLEQNKEDARLMATSMQQAAKSKETANKMLRNKESLLGAGVDANVATTLALDSKNADTKFDDLLDMARRATPKVNPDGTPVMLPPAPAQQTMVQPALSTRTGMLTPNITQKQISYENQPAIPGRQAVDIAPKLDVPALKLGTEMAPPDTAPQNVRDAHGRVMQSLSQNKTPDFQDLTTVNQFNSSNANSGKDPVMDRLITLVSSDRVAPGTDLGAMYRQMQGKNPNAASILANVQTKPKDDPMFMKKMQAAKQMGMPPVLATQFALDMAKIQYNQNDPSKGTQITYWDPGIGDMVTKPLASVQGGTLGSNPALQTPITGPGKQGAVGLPKQPSVQTAGTADTVLPTGGAPAAAPAAAPAVAPMPNAAQPQQPAPPVSNQKVVSYPSNNIFPKDIKDAAIKYVSDTPLIISQIKSLSTAMRDPSNAGVAGIQGYLSEHGGGLALNALEMIPYLGGALSGVVDNKLGISKLNEIRTNVRSVEAKMAQQILNEKGHNISNTDRERVAEIAGNIDSAFKNDKQIAENFDIMYRYALNNTVHNVNIAYAADPRMGDTAKGQPTPEAQQLMHDRYDFYTKTLHYQPDIAQEMLARELNLVRGHGLGYK